jgi:hypothetical protein
LTPARTIDNHFGAIKVLPVNVSFTIKDCPREVKAALELSARRNWRSQNAGGIVWLEERARSLGSQVRESELLRRIEAVPWQTRLEPEEQEVLRKAGRA